MTDKPSDRQEFEAAFPQLDHRDYLAEGAACYIDPKTQGAWEGWMARGRRIAAAPDGAQAVVYVSDHDLKRIAKSPLDTLTAYGRPLTRANTPLYTAPPSQDAEDAARYRHARDNYLAEMLAIYLTPDTSDVGLDAAIDAAIDAARAARGGG